MPDKVFIDSNILIYAYSIDEPKKQHLVKDLLSTHDTIIISTQTINEFINVTIKKKMLNYVEVTLVTKELFELFLVKTVDQEIIQKAIILANTYHYSYFDCLMLACALLSDCSILYSEDMHHSHSIENKLKILNPFK